MNAKLKTEILDITKNKQYERYLYRCLASMPLIKYKNRREYLETAIPKGFHKKLVTLNGEVVGQIEYAPAEASGFPIAGQNVVVMNCIWILRRAKGHNLGKLLFDDMVKSEKTASAFATIALENHWSPWMRKEQMEKFGFKPIDSLNVTHKLKRRGECFKIHLMCMPTTKDAKPPTWDKAKILEGVDFCLAHPLYRPQKTKQEEIFEDTNPSKPSTYLIGRSRLDAEKHAKLHPALKSNERKSTPTSTFPTRKTLPDKTLFTTKTAGAKSPGSTR